ncbi:MAG: hypothetical protein QOG72_536 [Sphingomonadales bacterium]|nr:hypothetical protein [Sphingomonadales bacterium]
MSGSWRLGLALAASVLGASGCDEPSLTFHPGEAGTWKMIVRAGLDQDTILRAARWRCGTAAICQVSAYTSDAYLKPDIPEDERWRATVFTYSRNSNSGFEQILWDCSVYRDAPRERCRGEPIVDPEL